MQLLQRAKPLIFSSCKLSTCIYLFLLSFPARYDNLGMVWEPTGVILDIDLLPWWHFDLVAQRKLHGCKDLLLCQISAGCSVISSSASSTFFRERESKGEMLFGKELLSTFKSSLRNELWSGRWSWSTQKAPHNKAVHVSGQRVKWLLED